MADLEPNTPWSGRMLAEQYRQLAHRHNTQIRNDLLSQIQAVNQTVRAQPTTITLGDHTLTEDMVENLVVLLEALNTLADDHPLKQAMVAVRAGRRILGEDR